jgi:ParB family chromosome partitioning protein
MQILDIEISRIYPHPNNPRKNLGDLTELTESIKAAGIRQNLTVIPKDMEQFQKAKETKCAYTGDFWAVIGHRRRAAAELTGLKFAPCSIEIMDEKQQIATMMVENMQRSDLTVIEQAEGFQMMLDLGESYAGIRDKTGFSETTVRRRVKLLEYDRKKLQRKLKDGATLMDFAELDRLKDQDRREKVFEALGTQSFDWRLKDALEEEKNEACRETAIADVKTFASEGGDWNKHKFIGNFNFSEYERPADAGTVKYFYNLNYNNINLYREYNETEIAAKAEQSAGNSKEQERKVELKRVNAIAFSLRKDFIRNFTGAKRRVNDILNFATGLLLAGSYSLKLALLADVLGFEFSEDEDEDGKITPELITEMSRESPEKILLATAYAGIDGENMKCYRDWVLVYERNYALETLYNCLEELGYGVSDEERQLLDGTHELYKKAGVR